MFHKRVKIIISLIIMISLTACSSTYVINNKCHNKSDYVVILHGIMVGNWQMDPLASYLAEHHYEVINVSYPSTTYDLTELKKTVTDDLKKYIKEDKPVHFVGYSMGGLVLRAVLKDYRPNHMGRVIHIATPNKGSEIADIMQNCPLYKLFFGPAGQQLVTNQSQFQSIFGKVDYELGIISGYDGFGFPFSGKFSGDNDGKVSVESTLVEGYRDHIKIRGTHSLLPFNSEVKMNTLNFIKQGNFLSL